MKFLFTCGTLVVILTVLHLISWVSGLSLVQTYLAGIIGILVFENFDRLED